MDKENENNASVEGITTAVFCREGDLKQFADVFARLEAQLHSRSEGRHGRNSGLSSRSMTPRGS